MERTVVDEIDLLIAVLPAALQAALAAVEDKTDLVEIVMDLGRRPEVRTYHGQQVLGDSEVTETDLQHVVDQIGDFGDDNRAGIARTLHRISAIRNRKHEVIGLTLRIGRAVYGTVEPVRDVVESGESVLLLGRPGVGTT
ncbi:MAG: AAA family ATPase, partial [Anaerolineae bacterium]